MGTHGHSLCGQPRRQGHSGRGPTASAAEAPDGARSGRGPTCSAQRAPHTICTDSLEGDRRQKVGAATLRLPAGKHRGERPGSQGTLSRRDTDSTHWKREADQSVFIQTRTSAFERQLKNKDNLP